MIRGLAVSLFTALAVLASTVSMAAADTVSFTDPRGDAPARFDLTRTVVSNGPARIVVTQRVRNLRGDRTQVFGVNVFSSGRGGTLLVVRHKNGTLNSRWTVPSGKRCAVRARWQPVKNLIWVSMPRACVPRKGALRVSTAIGAGAGRAGDPADWTKTVRVGQG